MAEILMILKLNQDGILRWDYSLYIIESLARAHFDKVGSRAYRNENGILMVDWPDNHRSYYE